MSATVDGSSHLRCSAPARTFTGSVPVKVTVNGRHIISPGLTFIYRPPVIIEHIIPSSGLISGGTLITMLGRHDLIGVHNCKFSDKIAAATLESSSKVLCLTPAIQESGRPQIYLGDENDNFVIIDKDFQYFNPILVSRISPTIVSSTGGDPISIFGSDFMSCDSIFLTFGGRSTIETVKVTSSLLRATAPAQQPGTTLIEIGGNRVEWTPTNVTAVIALPFHVYSIKPSISRVQGGTLLTIFGQHFIANALFECRFADQWVNATFVSDSTLTCATPSRGEPVSVALHIASDDLIGVGGPFFIRL